MIVQYLKISMPLIYHAAILGKLQVSALNPSIEMDLKTEYSMPAGKAESVVVQMDVLSN